MYIYVYNNNEGWSNKGANIKYIIKQLASYKVMKDKKGRTIYS